MAYTAQRENKFFGWRSLMLRDNKIDFKKTSYLAVVDIGFRNTGKTYETLQWIEDYISARKKYRVFIIMTLNHKKYRKFKTIKPNEIPGVTQGVCRLVIDEDDFPKVFKHINHPDFENAMIIFEDASSYFTEDRLPKAVRKFIVDSKQKDMHLVFQYHCWAWVQLDYFRIVDFLRIHKTIDTPETRKKYIGIYKEVEAVYISVRDKPSPIYYAEEIRIGA